jgi:GcrA cell cycle regulator
MSAWRSLERGLTPSVGWTPDRVDQLRRLWASGMPGAEIRRQLGISKNAVIGKADRLDLAARPSLLLPGRNRRPERRTANAEPMPPLLVAAVRPVIAAPVRPVVAAATRHERIEPCCWVIGERGQGRKWRYFDSDSMPDRPYCLAHAIQAWPAIKRAEGSLAHSASAGGEG